MTCHRTIGCLWLLVAVLLPACRPQGLPAEPAGADATDPEAPVPAAARRPIVEASAFEGVEFDGADQGHAGHDAAAAPVVTDAVHHGSHGGTGS